MPVTAEAAATTPSAEKGERIQVPTDSGEVGLSIRSMCRNRAGRPRSWTSNPAPATAPPAAPRRATRLRLGRPVRAASSASTAEAPARPPLNRYSGTSGTFQVGCLRIGRP